MTDRKSTMMTTQFMAVELKEKLKSRNLPTTGSKNELLRQLVEAGVPSEELSLTTGHASEELMNLDKMIYATERLNSYGENEIWPNARQSC